MRGMVADVHAGAHLKLFLHLFHADERKELWHALNLSVLVFPELNLVPTSSDRVVWETCQQRDLVLLTNNRNAQGEDSLEETIRGDSNPSSLPVITVGDANRFLRDRTYAEQAADRLLEYLFDMENLRGSGRIFVP